MGKNRFNKPFYLNNTQINKTIGKVKNRSNFNHYVEQFVENALSIFEWKNLPPEIPEYVLEKYLLMFGMMCLYKDTHSVFVGYDDYGNEMFELQEYYKVAPFTIQFYNDYWEPTVVTTVNIVSPSKTLYEGEFAYCFNNKSGYPTINNIYWFADVISEIETSLNIATKQLRVPFVFEGTQTSKSSIDDIFNQLDNGNVTYFVLSKDFINGVGMTKHDLLNASSEKRIDTLYMEKEKYLQEWNTRNGIHSNINNKNERLTENESIGYNEIGNINVAGQLQMRQEFCKRAKLIFGLDIDVQYSSIVRERLKEESIDEDEVIEDADD